MQKSKDYFGARANIDSDQGNATIYRLDRLEKAGHLKSEWAEMESGKPRKYYRLTRKGRKHSERTVTDWREFFEKMADMLPEERP